MEDEENLSEGFGDAPAGAQTVNRTTTPTPSGDPVIESDVPIPTVTRRKYPFDQMKPGDSFELRADPELIKEHGETTALQRLRSSLSSSAASYAKRNPKFKLVVRKTGPATLRCWAVQKEADEE